MKEKRDTMLPKFWKDIEKTKPAKVGDSVAVMECCDLEPWLQADPEKRPIWGKPTSHED